MRIEADRERCVGAGQCVLTEPKLFDQSEEDGRVLLLATETDDVSAVRAAIDVCPSGALSLADDR